MNPLLRCLALSLALLLTSAHAGPVDAARVVASFKSDMAGWSAEVAAATTLESRAQVLAKQPDPATYGRRMWTLIAPSLDQEWVLDPLAWFISLGGNLQAGPGAGGGDPAVPAVPATARLLFAKELEAVYSAITTFHLKSPNLGPVCLAFAGDADPRSLALLEKIETTHPDKSVQGVAALATAIRLRSLGDDPGLLSRRLKLLRKAIIESADVEIHGVTVAKLAEDELYLIRNLSKGRVAPDLVGVDSGGRPMRLEAYRGKTVVLLFWNSNVPDVVKLLENMGRITADRTDKPVVVVGVNNDSLAKLRSMQQNDADLLDFPNFSDPGNQLAASYRVGTWPLVYVLDSERRIQYAGPPGSLLGATVDALLAPAGPRTPARAPTPAVTPR